MSLVEKGKRNLKLARILETDEFCELSKFQKEHLCSVIINRLYYGVYLLGKDRLLVKDNTIQERDFLGHGTENAVKEIRNNDKAKQSKLLWVRLHGFYGSKRGIHRTCLDAAKLYETRNFYDYRCDVKRDKALDDLKAYKKQADSLIKRLGGLK